MGTWNETGRHAAATLRSIRDSRAQAASVVAILAIPALASPTLAVACGALGAVATLARRSAPGDRIAGRDTAGPRTAGTDGSYPIGRDGEGNTVRLAQEDVSRHVLVTGTAAGGKGDVIDGMAEETIASGAGLLYVDGTGTLFARICEIAAAHGREDDVLLLDLTNGAAGPQAGRRETNTLNPFATGQASSLAQVVSDLMADEGRGDTAVWKGRSVSMAAAVLPALTWLRDERGEALDVNVLREAIRFGSVASLADPAGRGAPLPENIRAGVAAYLRTLPGYNPERGEAQGRSVIDHHGYLEMQLARTLELMGKAYAHVFVSEASPIDMDDVVGNRRILVVMLPVPSDGNEDLADLGRVVVSALKRLMGRRLSGEVAGKWDDIVERRAPNRPHPFLVVLDEVGHYAVPGLATMAANARSLGFSMIYGASDEAGPGGGAQAEWRSMLANTATRIRLDGARGMTLRLRDVVLELAPIRRGTRQGREHVKSRVQRLLPLDPVAPRS